MCLEIVDIAVDRVERLMPGPHKGERLAVFFVRSFEPTFFRLRDPYQRLIVCDQLETSDPLEK